MEAADISTLWKSTFCWMIDAIILYSFMNDVFLKSVCIISRHICPSITGKPMQTALKTMHRIFFVLLELNKEVYSPMEIYLCYIFLVKRLSDQLLDDRIFKEPIITPMPCLLVKGRCRSALLAIWIYSALGDRGINRQLKWITCKRFQYAVQQLDQILQGNYCSGILVILIHCWYSSAP